MGFSALTIDTTSPPRFSSRQRVILLVLLGAGFMLSVDCSILNVALPEAGAGVGLGLTELPWITSAFALPAAGFTLLFGRLADLFGRRRLFLSGMVLLTGASLLGGFASNPEMLLTARVLQGVATAMTIPAAMSLLTTTFAEGAMRNRVLGLNGALLSGGFTAGVIAGRFIGRFGSSKVLVVGLAVQGLATLPLVFLGTDRAALAVLIPALFIGFFGHVAAIVAYTVTGTSGLPNEEQGLATGLTTMTQQVAITVGIPILSAVAATQSVQLTGIHLALSVNVAVTLASVVLVWLRLRPCGCRSVRAGVVLSARASDL